MTTQTLTIAQLFQVKDSKTHYHMGQPLYNNNNWDVDLDTDKTDGRVVYYSHEHSSWMKIFDEELFSQELSNDEYVSKWLRNTDPCVVAFSDRYSAVTSDHGFIALVTHDNVELLTGCYDNLTYKHSHHEAANALLGKATSDNVYVPNNVYFGIGETITEATANAMWMYLVAGLYLMYPKVYTKEMVDRYLSAWIQEFVVNKQD
jgi:hypothetical protein